MAPTTMIALVQQDGKLTKQTIPIPKPEPHQLLVKVSHVAQNPTDVQCLDRNSFGDGTVFGCDFVGTVVEAGKDVDESRIKKGDVIAGLIWGGEFKHLGAYAEYTLADQNICFKVPSSITPAAAATIPLAAATAYLSLFSKSCLDINRHSAKNTPILIWGGSSSVGLHALQLSYLHNLSPILTTCSPQNNSLLTSHHATHIFDHTSPSAIVEDIKRTCPSLNNLKYIFDTIGNATSSALASQVATITPSDNEDSGEEPVLCTVRPGKANTEDVKKGVRVVDVLVWTAFLKDHRYGEFYWPKSEEDHGLVSELFQKMPAWLESGEFVPNPTRVKKGLDGVEEGFREYREGKISACKIVYEI